MVKKELKGEVFEESLFRLTLNDSYFGEISAIQNENNTEYALIYKKEIPSISGPPGEKKVYLGNIQNINELEKVAFDFSKKIAEKKGYSFRLKDRADYALEQAVKYASEKQIYVPTHLRKDKNNKANLSAKDCGYIDYVRNKDHKNSANEH